MLCERRLEHISSTSGRIFTLPSIFIAGSIERSHSLAATSSRSCLCGALIIVSARSSRARATLSVDASGVWVWPVCSCRGGDPARARVASRDRIANRALSNHTHTLSYSIARCTHLTSTYRLRYLIFRRLLIAYIKRMENSQHIRTDLLIPNASSPHAERVASSMFNAIISKFAEQSSRTHISIHKQSAPHRACACAFSAASQ